MSMTQRNILVLKRHRETSRQEEEEGDVRYSKKEDLPLYEVHVNL